MTKQDLVKLAIVMTTLAEGTGPVPASSIYLGMGADYSAYTALVDIGARMGWLTVTSTTVGLTPKGRAQAEKFAAVM